jgi:hypothetical protein
VSQLLSSLGVILAAVAATVVAATPALQPSLPAPATTPIVASTSNQQACAWHYGAIGKERFGNSDFIDSAITYLVTPFKNERDSTLRVHGNFPYARYMSFSTYSGKSMTLIDRIVDQSIVPDRGSNNPFLPSANRSAEPRSYTLTIRPGPAPAHGRPPNTVYSGSGNLIFLMYRIYAPDKGVNPMGNVPKPRIAVVKETATHVRSIVTLPECTPMQPVRATFRELIPKTMTWYPLMGTGKGGANGDDSYLQVRLDRPDSSVYVIRFKAPSFANTYRGHGIRGHEDVRYWSLCMYVMLNTKLVGCLHDYQAIRSRSGYVTVVVSAYARKPREATRANGVNWLPFGPERIGMLTYRQLLPRDTFQGSVRRLAMNASQAAIRATLGAYFPSIRTCAWATYSPRRCD